MHVPYTKLWEYIPDNAKVAFSSSEDLCVELRLSDSATVDELAKCQRLPTGTAIDDLLSSEIMDRIASYLQRIRQLLPNWLDVSGVSSLFGGGAAAYRLVIETDMVQCSCDVYVSCTVTSNNTAPILLIENAYR